MFLHFQSPTPRQKEAFQCFNKIQQDHLRMNVAPDRTIILGLQIVSDHKSLSSKDLADTGKSHEKLPLFFQHILSKGN